MKHVIAFIALMTIIYMIWVGIAWAIVWAFELDISIWKAAVGLWIISFLLGSTIKVIIK